MDRERQRGAVLLGQRLRGYRTNAGLGVNQLAEYSGVSAAYISRLERGLVPRPSAPMLQKITAKLNITVMDLLGGDERAGDQELASLLTQVEDLPEPARRDIKDYLRFKLQSAREQASALVDRAVDALTEDVPDAGRDRQADDESAEGCCA